MNIPYTLFIYIMHNVYYIVAMGAVLSISFCLCKTASRVYKSSNHLRITIDPSLFIAMIERAIYGVFSINLLVLGVGGSGGLRPTLTCQSRRLPAVACRCLTSRRPPEVGSVCMRTSAIALQVLGLTTSLTFHEHNVTTRSHKVLTLRLSKLDILIFCYGFAMVGIFQMLSLKVL